MNKKSKNEFENLKISRKFFSSKIPYCEKMLDNLFGKEKSKTIFEISAAYRNLTKGEWGARADFEGFALKLAITFGEKQSVHTNSAILAQMNGVRPI